MVNPTALDRLVSEARNPATTDIDALPTLDMLRLINNEDKGVALAVEKVLPEIALTVERIASAFQAGGRLIYVGAGTSGRLGVLDASECPPTFGVPETKVIALMAGGTSAITHPTEGAEDDAVLGAADLAALEPGASDVVVGISASGRTPYVIGALDHARSLGAATVALSCNPASPIAAIADIAITPIVGPEALTGSTRMKAGTAQKMVLNMLSTGAMIRTGKTYQNLMVDLHAGNDKLKDRATRIVMQATGCSVADARQALQQAGGHAKRAILMLVLDITADEARVRLDAADAYLRRALG